MRSIHFLFAMGFFSFLFGMSSKAIGQEQPSSPSQVQAPTAKPKPEDVGRELRKLALTTPPDALGDKPTEEFPRVYGILMDFPVGEITATVLSTSVGAASLYTTSTFGVLGGEGHEKVRKAAQAFVRAAEHHFDEAKPTAEFPYPSSDRVRFYFLTFSGVRFIETDLESVRYGTSKHSELYRLGQAVLTELRLITQERQ